MQLSAAAALVAAAAAVTAARPRVTGNVGRRRARTQLRDQIVVLRGLTNQNRALFRVSFGGNIAIPTGGTVEAITAALAINGEPLTSATATVTPAAVGNYFNIYVSAQVCVPKGCCLTVAMENTSTQAVNFANSNLTVERIA